MAEEVKTAEHVGDSGLCSPMNDEDALEEYCTKNYIDDFEILTACRDFDTFCYMCCDNEFGDFVVDEKTKCFAMCDEGYKQITALAEPEDTTESVTTPAEST